MAMALASEAEERRSQFPWRCCLGYLAMEVCALSVMEWATRPAP